jgi:hypothetical protein
MNELAELLTPPKRCRHSPPCRLHEDGRDEHDAVDDEKTSRKV